MTRTISAVNRTKYMESLINQFTKNLSGCKGCGSNGSVYETWLKAKETGEKMRFQFSVIIEADTYKQAINKIPDEFEILQGGVKPQPQPKPEQQTQLTSSLPRTA